MATWREERRQDRLSEAQIRREDEAARAKLRTAEKRAALDRAEAKRKAKAARTAGRLAALRARAVDLVLAPVIVTGAVLAWFGMGGYGVHAYGPVGIILPVLSEGGMWAFAAATTITLHRHPDAPVWHLRTGTAVFALVGAALNYLHGAHDGQALAVTMAIVSVSGVLAHQLITAGPRRSRADRAEARIQRRVEKRIREAREAAVDAAPVDLHAPGGPAIMLPSGGAEPPVSEPARTVSARPQAERQRVAEDDPRPVTVAVNSGPHGTLRLTFMPATNQQAAARIGGSEVAQFSPVPWPPRVTPVELKNDPPVDPPADPRNDPGVAKEAKGSKRSGRRLRPKADKVTALIKAGKTTAEIMRATGASESTVKRRRSALREGNVVQLDARRASGTQAR